MHASLIRKQKVASYLGIVAQLPRLPPTGQLPYLCKVEGVGACVCVSIPLVVSGLVRHSYALAAARGAVAAVAGDVPSNLAADEAGLARLWMPFVSARSGTAEVRVGRVDTAYWGDTRTPAGQKGSPGGSFVLGMSGMTTYSMGVTVGAIGAAAAAAAAVVLALMTLGVAGEGINGGEMMAGSAGAECGEWAAAALAAP